MVLHGKLTAEHFKDADAASIEVFEAFRSAMMLHRQLMMRLFAEKGAHPGQAACLWVLAKNDGIAQRDLAEKMHTSRPNITVMLQKMEKAGLIERKVDETDQRLTRIHLAEPGRELLADLKSVFGEVIGTSIGEMSEGDRRELARLLGIMSEHVQRALDKHPDRHEMNEGGE